MRMRVLSEKDKGRDKKKILGNLGDDQSLKSNVN